MSRYAIITFTKVKLPYGWLSNMSPHPIQDQKLGPWRTAEHLFQAMRFRGQEDIIGLIHDCQSPMGAKMMAKKYLHLAVVEPRSQEDLQNMVGVLAFKVKQHPDLLTQLLATGDELLVEDVSRRASESGLFWGMALQPDGSWAGKNQLGFCWDIVRKSYKDGSHG